MELGYNKLKGPVKWTYFYLYMMLDIFSRYVVGWMVAPRESAELAKRLIGESCEKEGIEPGQLIIHSDRGSPMKAKTTGQFLADLGVTKSHSRPHVSDDNPFSEAGFKTLRARSDITWSDQGVEAPGWRGARRAHIGNIRPPGNESSRDGSAA